MSLIKQPNGSIRVLVHDPTLGRNVHVGYVRGRRKAEAVYAEARRRMTERTAGRLTVAVWRERWITDPLFARVKESTDLHNAERTKAFVESYGHLPLDEIDDGVVGEWLAGGKRNGTVPALRAMFNDARSAKAGRLIERNPFAGLGISKSKGNATQQPPTEEQMWEMVHAARRLAGPSFAAWLQVAAFTGIRPGELDALRWEDLDFDRGRIRVERQFSAKTRKLTAPKTIPARWAPMPPAARDALRGLARDGEYCFRSLRGTHWTASSRAYHWNAVRSVAGWDGTCYLATRHFAGWYMVNVLDVPSEDVAIALGHSDGGMLVRNLYGHRDHDRALERVNEAYSRTGSVTPLRVLKGDG